MGIWRNLVLWATVAFVAACGSTSNGPITIPEAAVAPQLERAPRLESDSPRLVPYPGLEVSYVANVDREVYFFRGTFYCYAEGRWFQSAALDGSWAHVQMRYVPADLFRVRGHLPPGVRRHNDVRVELVAGRETDAVAEVPDTER
jgi:predicted small lipoprotein YifL